MAKKKSNPHSDTTKPPKPQDRAPIDDIHSEKLDSLKSLNAMLLKETVERRNQVDSLTQANSALESELTRCNSELSGWTEQAVMLEIEKGVANRFVEVQVVEMVEKVEGFLVEDERDVQEKKKNELQSSVDGLNELVRKLEQGKAQLVNEVVELEKKCVGSLDKEVKMRAEFDVLAKEKQEMEVEIERLTKEKSLVAKDLDDALNSLRKQNLKVDQLDKEKTKIIDAKNQAETDVIKLKEQLEELKNTVKTLEKVSIAQTDKINELEAEKSRYIAASDQATKERNNVRATLDGEKEKVKNLTEKISKIEKDMEDMQKKLSKMQKETEKLVAEKKDLEKSRAVLEKDILAIKKSLAKTQKDYEDTEGKLKVSEANSRKILKILKNTSSICNSKEDKNKGIDKETAFGEEIKHHVTEVEAIKKAFKEKESVADEMKKQLELLKVRVAKADKGKSFWTMVSSATTLLAAVSLAYVARGGY
ncbi:hypothetical protein HanPI659440_Chr07g0259141 [Helianthus annuus]|nr:hypothetical protein HanPI659440_Chr07g0259141 [Helianthus annuus]